MAILAEHLAVDVGGQTTHREARIHRFTQRQVEHRPRCFILWRKVFRLLVELRVFAVGGVFVVAVQGRDQITLGNSQRGFHLLHSLVAVDELDQWELRALEMVFVDDQERGVIRLLHHKARGARVIGLLGYEPLTEFVHDEPG